MPNARVQKCLKLVHGSLALIVWNILKYQFGKTLGVLFTKNTKFLRIIDKTKKQIQDWWSHPKGIGKKSLLFIEWHFKLKCLTIVGAKHWICVDTPILPCRSVS